MAAKVMYPNGVAMDRQSSQVNINSNQFNATHESNALTKWIVMTYDLKIIFLFAAE